MSSKSKNKPAKLRLSIAMLSMIFVAAYFVLRALPDAQCGFLHYIEIVNADGEIELCATNHAGFIDLSVLTYPVVASLETEADIEKGQLAEVVLNLETSGGMSIAPHELAITHTKKMHLMVIDPSLEDYHHLHPKAEGLEGRYDFEFRPERAGTYRVFTEIVPVRSRRQAIALSELEVPGVAEEPHFERSTSSIVDGLRFELLGAPQNLKTGRDYQFELKVRDAETGERVDLEIVMGAKGHMVAFDAHAMGFAHMHPVDSVLSVRTASIVSAPTDEPDLNFLFNVPNPGWYRLFAQIQIEGEAVFGKFDLKIGD